MCAHGQGLLHVELGKLGIENDKSLCEHFPYTRTDLYEIITIQGIRTFSRLIGLHGKGLGCEIRKPTVASIFASVGNGPVLRHHPLQDTKVKQALGLAKTDFEIFQLLGRAWGMEPWLDRWTDAAPPQGYPVGEAVQRRLFADGQFFTADKKAKFLFTDKVPFPEIPDETYPFFLPTGRGDRASGWSESGARRLWWGMFLEARNTSRRKARSARIRASIEPMNKIEMRVATPTSSTEPTNRVAITTQTNRAQTTHEAMAELIRLDRRERLAISRCRSAASSSDIDGFSAITRFMSR